MQVSAELILASQSPRRQALLDQIHVSYTVRVSPADETVDPGLGPQQVVHRLADRKATPVAAEHPTALTLAADTVVALDGEVLTKPQDATHAAEMLRRLSGTQHTVYTGLTLLHPASDRQATRVEATEVHVASPIIPTPKKRTPTRRSTPTSPPGRPWTRPAGTAFKTTPLPSSSTGSTGTTTTSSASPFGVSTTCCKPISATSFCTDLPAVACRNGR